ncbi:hypothetical protein B9Z55_003075 [Caenorhabditis nigoni]|nr:hypothetical protein B9Z55_003075 [Caenorhabditis nigoni]
MEPYQDEDEKRLELIVDHADNDKKVIKWKYVDSLDNLDILKEFRLVEGLRETTLFDIKFKSGLLFEINGLRCECSITFDPKSGIPTLYFEKHLMKKWPMEIQKYCVELFQTTPDLEMILNLNDLFDLPKPLTIKDLYIQTCKDDVDPTIAEELFEKANIQRLSVRRQYFAGRLGDDSKLWNIPNLLISCRWVGAEQLIRFKGKNACIYIYENKTREWNAFLKHWLHSDNTNLETMMITGYAGDTEQLLDGIQTSRWDPKKRPARYVQNEQ